MSLSIAHQQLIAVWQQIVGTVCVALPKQHNIWGSVSEFRGYTNQRCKALVLPVLVMMVKQYIAWADVCCPVVLDDVLCARLERAFFLLTAELSMLV